MKSEELMVGDFVRYTDKYPYEELRGKVARVERVGGRMSVIIMESGKYQDSQHPAYFEGIPITMEILEKNGFVEYVFCEGEYELQCEGYRIIIHLSSGYTRIYKGRYLPILNNQNYKFVHELQHALRLCGIDKTIEL